MKLLPVPGAPGYRIDCDNMVAYSMKRGVLKKLNERTKYRTVHLTIDRITYGTTIYRMMYCATNNIDITKIPRDLCIGLMGGTVTVMTRSDVQTKTLATKKAARMQVKKWSDMVWKIQQYYKGDCKALLDELKRAQKWVERWFIDTYGTSRERAELCAEYGAYRYLERLREGYPQPHIYTAVLRYARGERDRQRKQWDIPDNFGIIEL